MNSSRSYVVRALIDWIVDNNCTPHIVIDSRCDGVEVPEEYVTDGLITLNVAGVAVHNWELSPSGLSFDARFRGTPHHIACPVGAIVGVYAKENQQGETFLPDNTTDLKQSQDSANGEELPPYLRVVKD